MAIDYEIETYWNVETLSTVLNAVSGLMGSGDYSAMIKMIFTLGVAIGLFVYMGNRQLDFAKWVLNSLVVIILLNMPIARITLVDKTDLEPPKTIDHIPWMMATAAYVSNLISNFMTTSYENMVLVPEELGLAKGDLAFGHSVLKHVNQATIADPNLKADLMQFFKECTLYDVRDGVIPAKDLVGGTSTWDLVFSNTNPARFVTYDVMTGSPKTDTCTNVANILKLRVNDGINKAMAFYGRQLFPRANSDVVAQEMFANAIGSANTFLLKSGASASDSMKQAMFNNVWREAGTELPVLLNDPARAAQVSALAGAAQAAKQAQGSQNVISLLARDALPHIRNWIEAILYAIFPFVTILILISPVEATKKILTGYFMGFVWIGLWPVMFAVINSFSLMLLQKKLAALQLATQTGIPFQLTNTFDATIIDEQALVGWMIVLVPFLAGAVVKLGEMGITGMGDKMFAGLGSAGGAAGASMAAGNISVGQQSIDNASTNNASGNKYNMSGQMMSGAFTLMGHTGTTFTQTSSGMIGASVLKNNDHYSATQKEGLDAEAYNSRSAGHGASISSGTSFSQGTRSGQQTEARANAGTNSHQGQEYGVNNTNSAHQDRQSTDNQSLNNKHAVVKGNTTSHVAGSDNQVRTSMTGGITARAGVGSGGGGGGNTGNPSDQTSQLGGGGRGGRDASASVYGDMNAQTAGTTSFGATSADSVSKDTSADYSKETGIGSSLGVQTSQTQSGNKSFSTGTSQDKTRGQSASVGRDQSREEHRDASFNRQENAEQGGRLTKNNGFETQHDYASDPKFAQQAARWAGISQMKLWGMQPGERAALIGQYLNSQGLGEAQIKQPTASVNGDLLPTNDSMRALHQSGLAEMPTTQKISQGGIKAVDQLVPSTSVLPNAAAFNLQAPMVSAVGNHLDQISNPNNPASIPAQAAPMVDDVKKATDQPLGKGTPLQQVLDVEMSNNRDTWERVKSTFTGNPTTDTDHQVLNPVMPSIVPNTLPNQNAPTSGGGGQPNPSVPPTPTANNVLAARRASRQAAQKKNQSREPE